MSQRVVITGGASGIGRAFARRFARDGWRVALCGAASEAVAAMAGELPEAICRVADVRDEAQMAAFLAEVEAAWGGADAVCANAGTGGPAGLVESLDYQAWQDCVAVNLHGAFLTCRWAARVMRAQGSGAIVVTSSTSGQWGVPYRSPYVAAKWALVGLTKALAMELGAAGVRVNAICPGIVDTPMQDKVLERLAEIRGITVEDITSKRLTSVPLGRASEPYETAGFIFFLISDEGSYFTGQALSQDGGIVM